MIRTFHILTALHRRGAETFAVQMIDRLDRASFEPHIWPTRPVPTRTALVPERTTVLEGGAGSTPRVLWRLSRALRAVRPHLIQCHGGEALKFAVAAKPFYRANAYVYNKILSIHPHLDRSVRRLSYQVLFEQVDAIVAVGEELRREVIETLHPRRPHVLTIPNGRDAGPFRALTQERRAERRRELGFEDHHVCLIQVGIAWEKDPRASLRLLANLAPRFPNTRLVFVGEGPLEAALRDEAAALGLSPLVRVLGVRTDVPELLAAADLVLMPSITEGLPGVLIEAGMAGRPAVAYDTGSVRDVLVDGRTGYVVPHGDLEAMTRQAARLVGDPDLRRRYGAEAMVRCRRDFTIETSVLKYEALFSRLVGLSNVSGAISPEAVSAWPGS